MFQAVEWKDGAVRLLDQTCLPQALIYRECKDVETLSLGIFSLWVRGAPAIGIAAAYGLVLAVQKVEVPSFELFYQKLEEGGDLLAATRPTAVNLFWAIERMKKVARACRGEPVSSLKARLLAEARKIQEEDLAMNRAIGRFGAALLPAGESVLTHCNAGALATGGYGTALGVIRQAWENHHQLKVFVDETRPVLQGARLTCWELQQDKIPVTLITDNMAGYFMRKGQIQSCIVGADRIAANGDVANKIGTYSVAVLARAHGIPFYVAAPSSTLDPEVASGDEIEIEERPHDEVRQFAGKEVAPKGTSVANPAFDITPAEYITTIITDKGCFKPEALLRQSYRI